MNPRKVFITGGTGYVGRRLIPRLAERGHQIAALARKGSEGKLPAACAPVEGNALEKDSFATRISLRDGKDPKDRKDLSRRRTSHCCQQG